MTVNDLVALAHTFAGTTSSQITDMLSFVNIAYHDIEERIRDDINEDYFYDYFTTDTVALQSEYVFPAPASNTVGILKAISVGILVNNQYSPVRPFGSGSLSNTEEYLQQNQDSSNPFYIIKDTSIFLYPYPLEATVGGLRVHASTNLIDLVQDGTEATIKIPRNHHKTIALKAATYAYMNRSLGGTAIAVDTDNRAGMAIEQLINHLKDRTQSPMDQDLPSLSSLSY